MITLLFIILIAVTFVNVLMYKDVYEWTVNSCIIIFGLAFSGEFMNIAGVICCVVGMIYYSTMSLSYRKFSFNILVYLILMIGFIYGS